MSVWTLFYYYFTNFGLVIAGLETVDLQFRFQYNRNKTFDPTKLSNIEKYQPLQKNGSYNLISKHMLYVHQVVV